MYVIDGYNLNHKVAARRGMYAVEDARSRARLIELVAHLVRSESTTARIFFDGTPGALKPGETNYPHVHVTFSGPDKESADRDIINLIENAADPARLRVVTDDRRVAASCRLAGARLFSSTEMAGKLVRLAGAARAPRNALEKPSRGRIGRIEQEMIDDIGDEAAFEREVIRDLERRRRKRNEP